MIGHKDVALQKKLKLLWPIINLKLNSTLV